MIFHATEIPLVFGSSGSETEWYAISEIHAQQTTLLRLPTPCPGTETSPRPTSLRSPVLEKAVHRAAANTAHKLGNSCYSTNGWEFSISTEVMCSGKILFRIVYRGKVTAS